MDCLNVYLCGKLAGFLERNGKTVSFRYSPDYISDPKATVISSTLPLSGDRFEERDIMAFFSNLLPDEGVRRRIAEILRLSPDDTFGLLRGIGGDCAGAVAVWEPGKEPSCLRPPQFRELSECEADTLLRNLANRPPGIADDFRGMFQAS